MKIGISCYPTYGGSGAVATELGLGLAGQGHEVHFISYAPPFRLSGFQERLRHHQVARTRHGQKLGDALDQSQQRPLPPRHGAGPRTAAS